MRRVHVNYVTCPYFDPATVTEATGKLKSVLAIMIDHGHHQVAVFRDRIEGANEAPHAVLLQRL
jgi:beta-glucosidase-like glycosyl hydrolase